MENINEKYKEIFRFIDCINDFSDEEIYLKIDQIIRYLCEKQLYDQAEKIKILAIKKIGNLSIKLNLIKKYYFFEDEYMRHCFSWKCVMDSIENLNEQDKIAILRQLFLQQSFIENSHLLNIPNDIKFGIELEYKGVSYKQIKELFDNKSIEIMMQSLQIPTSIIDKIINNCDFEKENEFDKWIFSKEFSDDLPEVSSPIMSNTMDCLNQLESICLLFKALCAQTNGGTGLHMNIGVDYFNGNIDALKYLLIIWGECEELFYKIANQENEKMRICADSMSIPIKENIQKTFEKNANFTLNSQEDMDKFLYYIQVRKRLNDLLRNSHGNLKIEILDAHTEKKKYNVFKKYLNEKSENDTSIKHTSINFNHMTWNNKDKGRIEFRLFNSSLNFRTIIENIILICRLFETSLALTNPSEIKQQYFEKLLNRNVTEEEKLNLLLDLLFDSEEEKDIFRRRWLSVKDKSSYKKYYTGKKTFRSNSKENEKILKQFKEV